MLYDFAVFCTHKDKGCEWKGELRELDGHLNSSPSAESCLKGCQFNVIECPLKYAGCTFSCPRVHMTDHLDKSVANHTILQATVIQSLAAENKELKEKNRKTDSLVDDLEQENGHLEHKVLRLEKKVSDLHDQQLRLNQSGFPIGSVDFVMDNFHQRRDEDDYWYSPPFYTHPRGYKMCLGVNANGYGHGSGTHLSLYVFLMQGEFDDQLKWPFQGHVTVQLLNKNRETEHLTKKLNMTTQSLATQRVTTPGKSASALGFPLFITHSELLDPLCPYLDHDSLRFRVAKVELV